MDVWIITCDNCEKEYSVSEDKGAKEDLKGEEKLVLEANPVCPYCHTQNSRIASKTK